MLQAFIKQRFCVIISSISKSKRRNNMLILEDVWDTFTHRRIYSSSKVFLDATVTWKTYKLTFKPNTNDKISPDDTTLLLCISTVDGWRSWENIDKTETPPHHLACQSIISINHIRINNTDMQPNNTYKIQHKNLFFLHWVSYAGMHGLVSLSIHLETFLPHL